ncbi:MAG TPA: ribosomal-processing cysteine protease Prp [Candidatus Dormibacteraeota bacterium]|nr:ribosomal-processing cysteine protease Prp [Candidatus Dormibacteraeota bacterium]
MLTVTFFEDSRGRLSSFVASGHAQFADYGEDIVCAAVSSVLQAARLGLEEHARVAPEVEQESGDMSLRVRSEDRRRDDVRAILATALLAVERIAAQYPQSVTCRRETDSNAKQ